jgi:hypothetical protein
MPASTSLDLLSIGLGVAQWGKTIAAMGSGRIEVLGIFGL